MLMRDQSDALAAGSSCDSTRRRSTHRQCNCSRAKLDNCTAARLTIARVQLILQNQSRVPSQVLFAMDEQPQYSGGWRRPIDAWPSAESWHRGPATRATQMQEPCLRSGSRGGARVHTAFSARIIISHCLRSVAANSSKDGVFLRAP